MLFKLRRFLLQRRRHAHNGRHILGSGALAPLLSAAIDQTLEPNAPPDIQRADAARTMKLMPGKGQKIHTVGFDVHRNMPHRLHRIGMEWDFMPPTDL